MKKRLLAALLAAVLALAVGAIRQSDVAHIPGGRKLEKLMRKLRLWR